MTLVTEVSIELAKQTIKEAKYYLAWHRDEDRCYNTVLAGMDTCKLKQPEPEPINLVGLEKAIEILEDMGIEYE